MSTYQISSSAPDEGGAEDNPEGGSHSSLIDAEDMQLQAIESDESL